MWAQISQTASTELEGKAVGELGNPWTVSSRPALGSADVGSLRLGEGSIGA